MYRKNVAGQHVCFQLLLTATGAVATGLTPAVRRCIDGTFAAGGGTVTEDGTTGSYKYAMSQADTNGNNISFIFTGTGAMPVCVNIVTTAADPTDAADFGLTNLDPTVIADALLDRDMSTGTDSGSTTVRTMRQALRFLRNKFAIVAGTLTVYKEDDTTASWTAAITTTAGNPVSSSDPAGP
jgi:hypothetical protein